METRNLVIVIHNEQPKIAEYCQWDGHPDGQGITALKFLETMEVEKFKAQVSRCKFVDDVKQKEINEFFEGITQDPEGWMTPEQIQLYHKTYPLLTHDLGAGILQQVYDCPDETIWVHNECQRMTQGNIEWAYIIDLDNKTFEVYDGYNLGDALKVVKTYSLDNMPQVDDFLSYFERSNIDDG